MSKRPLPTVIGPTENALRSLLYHVLASTAINGYEEWVALVYANENGRAEAPKLAAVLKIDITAAERTIQQLTARGLITDLALTPAGQAELLRARTAVSAATSTLTEGIGEADQQTTRAVLDTMRERAEVALLAFHPESRGGR